MSRCCVALAGSLAMIKTVKFQNFKVLKDATLDLAPFTLIVGPNGSGKSTALKALQYLANPQGFSFYQVASAAIKNQPEAKVELSVTFLSGEILQRSEEHTSELQSHLNLVCRLLLEKKKKKRKINRIVYIKDHKQQ